MVGLAKLSVKYDIGIPCRFVQENQSYSKDAGTLRGMHFQVPPAAQAKLTGGRIFDVAVDVRRNSPTYGKFVSTELSAESGRTSIGDIWS